MARTIRTKIADYVFERAQKFIPTLTKTEEEALNAGDPWFEQSIFRGQADWDKVSQIKTNLTKEELSFLNNETQVLCDKLDEWAISKLNDLPKSIWQYLKENGFFGLVIDKQYGGKGFSAHAHSEIVAKIASRSGVAAVTVMVPNSLGPGELLQHYGTEEQKNYYLPRLAKGIDIPCFALTEPLAGSDATSIQSEAMVIEETIQGKKELKLRLTLNKRWITLSPVATLIGLAVQVKDPNKLLKDVGKEGITCILIPRDLPNLEIGNRHLPAHQPFMNGTIRGENVIVPLSTIIGGQSKAGAGWSMLVECLSIGRSISLPALATASSSICYITTGAYARIRRQFNVEIGQFEGIEEKLARIAGLSYVINATRLLTLAAVQEGKKPAVASAITKYLNTELARVVINDAMDVHGGRAVVSGPRNYLSSYYHSLPISITVEGANIMTRNLLIFGQGSMASHPFVRKEFYALSSQDKAAFQVLFWQHVRYFFTNSGKAMFASLTGGRLISTPKRALQRQYQHFGRLSYTLAWLSDLSLMTLGGNLKRKERVSARFGDALSHLYATQAVLHYFELNGALSAEMPHAQWAADYCLYQAEQALLNICQNPWGKGLPWRMLGGLVRFCLFFIRSRLSLPSDIQDQKLAKSMMTNNPFRARALQLIYQSGDASQPVDRVENVFQLLIKHADLYQKITDLRRFQGPLLCEKIMEKVQLGNLTSEEGDVLLKVEQARWDALQVDEFSFDSLVPSVKNQTSAVY
jgi:acyl-CoA dehydrogenase